MTTTPQLDGMPPELAPVPKFYLSGTPTPDGAVPTFTKQNVDDTYLVTVRAKVTKVGNQHQKQGAGPFVNLNAFEIDDIRPV